jgi:trimeric autotransporter adhesin
MSELRVDKISNQNGSAGPTFGGIVESPGYSVPGKSGFLKADGSVDTNTYVAGTSIGSGNLTLASSGTGLSVSSTPVFGANQSANKTITFTLNSSTSATNSTVVLRDSNGSISVTDVNSTSDINLKNNINNLSNCLEKIEGINGVSFNWKSNNQKSMGVIAQNIEEVFPELVNINDDNTKSVNYNGLIGVLVECIKELKNEINELKK